MTLEQKRAIANALDASARAFEDKPWARKLDEVLDSYWRSCSSEEHS